MTAPVRSELNSDDSREAALSAARAAADKQAENPVVLDMSEMFGATDYFVIASARNTRQARTVVDEVELRLREEHERKAIRVEGLRDATWILVDYGDVVVHVFLDETREYYDLERLWSGAPRVTWEEPTIAAL